MRFKAWSKKQPERGTVDVFIDCNATSFGRGAQNGPHAIARVEAARALRVGARDVVVVLLDEDAPDLGAIDDFVQDAERRAFGRVALVA